MLEEVGALCYGGCQVDLASSVEDSFLFLEVAGFVVFGDLVDNFP